MKKEFYYSKDGRLLSPGSNQNRWLWTRGIEDLLEGGDLLIGGVKPAFWNNKFCQDYHKLWSNLENPDLRMEFNDEYCGKCAIFKGLGNSCMVDRFYTSIDRRLKSKKSATLDSCIPDIMALVLWMEEFEQINA